MIDGLVYGRESQWIVDSPEEHPEEKSQLGLFKYPLRHKTDETTEKLQVQVTTFDNFLFGDIFLKDSHPRYKLRTTIRELADYERNNPRLYARMKKAASEILAFLPR